VTTEMNGRRTATGYGPPLISWEDFLAWALGSEGRTEWVDGEIVEIVGDNVRHFDITVFLIDLLRSFVEGRSLGRVFFLTVLMRLANRPSGRAPDIMFVANEHRD
jgi:Uma2 family endonuclease